MSLVVVTPPTSPGLIALADAKAQCRVDFDDDDDLITALILAAGNAIETDVQRRYQPQTLNWIRDHWRSPMALPVAPGGDASNIAINSVSYVDINGEPQTLDPCLYWDRPIGPTHALVRRWFAVWPLIGDGAMRVQVNFSILEASAAPPVVIHAVKLLVSHWYQNRDAVVGIDNRNSSTPMPLGVESLICSERWELPEWPRDYTFS